MPRQIGPEQSGHIAAVGYDMYCQLLERAVKGLKNETIAIPSETAIEIGVSGSIPKPYIPSDMRRLEAYRRIALAANAEELDKVRADLIAAYGDLPEPTQRLLQLAQLRTGARAAGVRLIFIRDPDIIFRTSDPAATAAALQNRDRQGADRTPASSSRSHSRSHSPPPASIGQVTILPPSGPGQLPEVYLRPTSPAMLEGGGATLLTILNRRFTPDASTLSTQDSALSNPATNPNRDRQKADRPPVPAPTPATKKPSMKPPPLSKDLKAIKKLIRGTGGSGKPPT